MRAALLTLALLLVSSSPAHAKSPMTDVRTLVDHMSRGLPTSKVGDWVTYKMNDRADPRRQHYWRIAVVGEEKDAQGRDAVWLELEMGQHHKMRAPLFQLRLLTAKDVSGPGAITRMYWAWGHERVRELAPEAVKQVTTADAEKIADDPDEGEIDPASVSIKSRPGQRLMTPAGTVTAVPVEVRYRSTVLQRYWLSREIPLLHLAKLEMPPIDHTIEVREYGTGFRSVMILPAPGQPTIGVEQLTQPPPDLMKDLEQAGRFPSLVQDAHGGQR